MCIRDSLLSSPNRNYTQLLANLRSALPSTSVEVKCSGKSLKLGVKTIVDFRAAQHFLSARNISLHTSALPEEREVKIVIQGIPYHTSSDAIVQELTTLGYSPTAVSVLHAGKGDNKHPVNSFLVKLLKSGNFEDVYSLQTLLHLRVTVRSFDPRPGPAQCFNCQGFGPSSLFCHAPPRCVQWGDPHRGCDKPRVPGYIPYCCNCKGAHPASHWGCLKSVSYTHLDVYKRQTRRCAPGRADRCCLSASIYLVQPR